MSAAAQELQDKLAQTRSELQAVKAQIAALKRSDQLSQIIKQDLTNEVGTDAQVWQGVGKMFMSVKSSDYLKSLDTRQSDAKDQVTALEKKEAYFAVTLDKLNAAITELGVH